MEREKSMLTSQESTRATAYGALMRKVYMWMAFALVATGLTAAYVAKTVSPMTLTNSGLIWGLVIAELALVLILSARIMKMSFATAGLMFVAYSVLNGVTMSFIFIAYTAESIASTFFITAGTFGVMALIGYFTKSDLSSWGKLLMMALVGLIIASIVNIFFSNGVLYWITTYAGILIFVGLTAYDSQRIKKMLMEYGGEVNEGTQKIALMGSLMLYLDFVNLFLYLLRIFGDRR